MKLPRIAGSRFTALVVAALVLGLAVAYSNSFGVGFYFDDAFGIRDNPAIRSLANIPSFFTDPFTLTTVRENVDIRPVLVTTYAVNYAISGNDPWSYHALNLLIHFVTSLLVFLLVRDHLWWPVITRGPGGSARSPAAAAALFFALAPINNQALNYLWARSALLCTALYVAAFYAMLSRRLALAVLLQLAALFTKAIALTLPAIFVIYDFLYRDRERHPDLKSWMKDWKELLVPLAPLVVADVAYLALRSMMLPDWAAAAIRERWVTPWIWCMSQWPALLHYVKMFVWPTGLSVDHDFPYVLHLTETAAWGSLLVLVGWVGFALRYSRRAPQVAFATLWFFVTLAPESTFSPLAEVVNDHRPYIASALGLSILLAWIVDRLSRFAGPRRREVFVAVVLLLCSAAALLGRIRTSDWRDEASLWESTIRTSPGNGRAWMNAGVIDLKNGNYAQARHRFEKAKTLSPTYPYLYCNFSALERAEGHPDQAVAWGLLAVKFGHDLARTHFFLAEALVSQGHFAEAVAEYRRSLDIDSRDEGVRAAMAKAALLLATADEDKAQAAMMADGLRLLDTDHDVEGAIARFRELLSHNPNHYGGTWQLARALDAAGRRDEARPIWEKMLVMVRGAKDAKGEAGIVDRLAHEKHVP